MKKIYALPFLLFFLYLLLSPVTALAAAREGLMLWYQSVLPTLFPFMLLCTLVLRLGLLDDLMPRIYKPFHALTGCSPYGAFAIVTGFFCGFPMGAKITHDLQMQKKISPQEACWLMGFVNNLSPAFLISFLACDQMQQPALAGVILVNVLGSSLLYGAITSFAFRKKETEAFSHNTKSISPASTEIFPVIDDCISDSIQNVLRLGAYITMFAILGSALEQLIPSGPAWGLLLRASMEVTGGIRLLTASDLPFELRFVLINALCAFGGFCALAQSAGIAAMDQKALFSYIKSRVCITLLSVVLCCGSILFRIFL